MRTVEVKLFSFDELDEKAKEKAIEDHKKCIEYGWSDENRASLEKFADIFDLKGLDWQYSFCAPWASASFESWSFEKEKLSGKRLIAKLWDIGKGTIWTRKYLKQGKMRDERPAYHPMRKVTEIKRGPSAGKFFVSYYSNIQLTIECPFTGVCSDHYLIYPIEKYLENPNPSTTFKELIKDCLHSWAIACGEDYEYTYSDEYVKEELENNDYEFTEDGEKY